jgi:hypothetical protein
MVNTSNVSLFFFQAPLYNVISAGSCSTICTFRIPMVCSQSLGY